jgi:hypothetical protein
MTNYKYVKRWCQSSLSSHKNRNCMVEISSEWLYDLAIKSVKCALCGIDLNWNGDSHDLATLPSLDRKYNSVMLDHYNVEIVCCLCNISKNYRTKSNFILYCKNIANRFKDYSHTDEELKNLIKYNVPIKNVEWHDISNEEHIIIVKRFLNAAIIDDVSNRVISKDELFNEFKVYCKYYNIAGDFNKIYFGRLLKSSGFNHKCKYRNVNGKMVPCWGNVRFVNESL